MTEFKSFKEFFQANPINEIKLSKFSKDNFPYSKFFDYIGPDGKGFDEETYMYPVKFVNGDIQAVFGNVSKSWAGKIVKKDFVFWGEIKAKDIPHKIMISMEKVFKPLQNK